MEDVLVLHLASIAWSYVAISPRSRPQCSLQGQPCSRQGCVAGAALPERGGDGGLFLPIVQQLPLSWGEDGACCSTRIAGNSLLGRLSGSSPASPLGHRHAARCASRCCSWRGFQRLQQWPLRAPSWSRKKACGRSLEGAPMIDSAQRPCKLAALNNRSGLRQQAAGPR